MVLLEEEILGDAVTLHNPELEELEEVASRERPATSRRGLLLLGGISVAAGFSLAAANRYKSAKAV